MNAGSRGGAAGPVALRLVIPSPGFQPVVHRLQVGETLAAGEFGEGFGFADVEVWDSCEPFD
jgi:hypothetical protein